MRPQIWYRFSISVASPDFHDFGHSSFVVIQFLCGFHSVARDHTRLDLIVGKHVRLGTSRKRNPNRAAIANVGRCILMSASPLITLLTYVS
jgi:hypothetical protein